MNRAELGLFRDSLGRFIESAFVNRQSITSKQFDRLRLWSKTAEAENCARQLFRDRAIDLPDYRLRLQLKKLRETDGKEFDHIEIIFIPDMDRRATRCFVGHRFSRSVESTLRWNLRQVLESYRVELDWSGRDIRSVQILEDIVNRIKEADFCVFDNRATQGRPNVYIEAGMCIALGRPFILFEFEPSSRSPAKPSAIPSDLSFALALRYRNYKHLFREFYSRFPIFFERNIHLR